jgi:hypothetical protein
LVDDRALADVDHDRLGHRDVVDELEQLVCATEVPASIALYGPWGSGKSSLANLLRERMGSRKIPFARFDAFKYAEAPMRRLFLSQVARELGVTGDPSNPEDKEAEKEKYESGLYTEVSYNTVTLPDAKVRRLVYVFLCVVGLGVLAIAGVLALVAIALDGPWSHAYSELLLAALPAGAIAAALIASVAAFANQTLPVNRKRSSPSSEEEFERLFRDLVKEVNAERIVIFIDELDRCSSREVVGTLETIRTFLEVKPCVVIVAADQQVLERALRRQARQETPFDSRNPYYSSGSAYLDKIFNFQVALPPLRSRRLSDFALELVDGLGGLWKEVDRGMVLLALIPTHVRSPRRVKALLNGFVANFRLAQRRAASGMLPKDVHTRAAEIARLTCLQIEFPLFAADLTIEPRLPEFVLRLHLDPEADLPLYVPEPVRDLARSYANCELDVDEVLPRDLGSDDGPGTRDNGTPSPDEGSPSGDGGETDPEDEAGDPNPEEDGDDDGEPSRRVTHGHRRTRAAVKTAQGQHLLEYLQRSEQAGEIRSDLVYLEGRGSTFGIDPSRAERLENAAVNGDRRAVAEAFDEASQEEAGGMLRLLAQVAREAPLGPEGVNAVQTMLSAAAIKKKAADQLAGELLRAFKTHSHHYDLQAADLPGALVLSLASESEEAAEMLGGILASDEAASDEGLGLALIGAGRRILDADGERAATVFGTWLDSSPLSTAKVVLELPRDVQDELLERGMGLVDERLGLRRERVEGQDAEGNPTENPGEAESLARRNQGLAEAIGLALAGGEGRVAEALAVSLLAADSQEARSLLEPHLEALSPASCEELRSALLVATRRRAVSDWPRWLGPIEPGAVEGVRRETVAALLKTAWNRATDEEPEKPEHLKAALDSVRPICDAVELEPDTLDGTVAESVRGALLGTSSRTLTELRGVAVEFTEYGLLSEQGAAIAFLADLQSVLGEPAVSDPDAAGASALELVEAYGPEAPPETLRAVLEAANGSQWLTQPAGPNLSLSVAAAIVDSGEDAECPVGHERVVELAGLGTAGAPAVGAWLGVFATSSEEVYAVLARLAHVATIPAPIADGLARWSEREGAGEALWVTQRYYEDHGLADPPDDGLLAALGACEPDEERVSEWLLKLFESANTNEERKGAMVAWRGFEPSDPSIRRRLITEVFLRLGEEYKGGFKLALKNIGLVADPPYGVKGEIKKTLRRQAKKHDLHNAAERALEEAGIDKAQIGLRDRIRREDSLDD